uniref:Uncharacterized protein n=1 Tax=Arundo donax TaxID=35708 RepID=A0A0A8YG50_ARUDO
MSFHEACLMCHCLGKPVNTLMDAQLVTTLHSLDKAP